MAHPPRGVDLCRLPAKRGLPTLHLAWLPRGAPLAFLVPPLFVTASTLLGHLANGWAGASIADEPCTPDESAILSSRPRAGAQYGSTLRAMVSYTVRTSRSTISETLVGILAERACMGAILSSIRGITWAVRAVEDLQWIQPAVATLYKRISAGAASARPQ